MKNGGHQKIGFSNPLTKHSLNHSRFAHFIPIGALESNWVAKLQLTMSWSGYLLRACEKQWIHNN
jgi:hypothetical protein